MVKASIQVERRDGIVEIVLDRPKVNALSMRMIEELRDTAWMVAEDETARAVLIRGANGCLSAGADIAEMAELPPGEVVRLTRGFHASMNGIAAIPCPVVVAVERFALGGGLELALAADFRVCGIGAVLGLPETHLGVIPGAGGTQRLPRLVGQAAAMRMILTGRPVSASAAMRMGLVHEVVEDVVPVARALADELARGSAAALREAKRAIKAGADLSLEKALGVERTAFDALFAHPDRQIGMRHFLEKRPGTPDFT